MGFGLNDTVTALLATDGVGGAAQIHSLGQSSDVAGPPAPFYSHVSPGGLVLGDFAAQGSGLHPDVATLGSPPPVADMTGSGEPFDHAALPTAMYLPAAQGDSLCVHEASSPPYPTTSDPDHSVGLAGHAKVGSIDVRYLVRYRMARVILPCAAG